MGPLDKFMLDEHSLAASDEGFTLDIRSHWYRSLPLSCVGPLNVSVDGAEIPADKIMLHVNEKDFAPEGLASLTDEWWFILDRLRLKADGTKLIRGRRYRVSVQLGLFIPYILVGPNAEPVLTTSRAEKELVCR